MVKIIALTYSKKKISSLLPLLSNCYIRKGWLYKDCCQFRPHPLGLHTMRCWLSSSSIWSMAKD